MCKFIESHDYFVVCVFGEKYEQFTIASDLILVETISITTATCVRANSIMTGLVTAMSSITAFINVWIEKNQLELAELYHNLGKPDYSQACLHDF